MILGTGAVLAVTDTTDDPVHASTVQIIATITANASIKMYAAATQAIQV